MPTRRLVVGARLALWAALPLAPATAPAGEGDATAPPPSSSSAADLLRPPGGSLGREPIDWETVPSWRQTSFFDVRAQGTLFVFVVDCSGSMADDFRLIRAKQELRRCIARLRWPQRYLVIFYNDRPIVMPTGLPQSPGATASARLSRWLQVIHADGTTDPREAMSQALALRPDAVYLVSDGEFPEGSVAAIAAKNPTKVPIHCIDLARGAATDDLGRIARSSGGSYATRP